MTIWPFFRYRFADSLRSSAVFFGILLIVTFCMIFQAVFIDLGDISGNISFSGFEIAACITLFVMGICTVREDLRLGIQNGVSRRTVFYATLLSSALIALILACAGELLTMAASEAAKKFDYIAIFSLYQMISGNADEAVSVTSLMHFKSVLFMVVILLSSNLAGSFISLMFFRLNKMWTIIVAVSVPLLLFWILPLMLSYFNVNVGRFFEMIEVSPALISIFYMLCAVVGAILNRLLMLRVPIKSAAK